MDLDRVRAFVATAEHLDVTRAAAELGLAQPALSARILGLERELGVRLFTRGRRQVELTPAGVDFLGPARTLLAAADAVADAAIARPGPRRLAITTLASDVDELRTGILPALRAVDATLAVTLTGVSFVDHVRVLHDGRADAAFVWPPYTASTTDGLRVEPVGDFARVLALPVDHPLADAPSIGPDQLAGLAQVRLPAGVDPVFVAGWRLVPEPVLADPELGTAGSVGQLVAAVVAGLGCCPVPALLARTCTTPGIAFVPLAGAAPATLALAWRHDLPADRQRLLADVARAARAAGRLT